MFGCENHEDSTVVRDASRLAKMLSFVLFGNMICWIMTEAFVAYDCRDPAVNVTAISLRGIAECPEGETDFEEKRVQVRVIQRNEIRQVSTFTCLIEVTRVISHCGMHSHSSLVNGGLATRIVKLGAEQCRNAHRYDNLQLYGQNILGLTKNGTTRSSATLSGKVSKDGSCSGGTYTEDGQSWENVYVVAALEIKLMDYWANVRAEENTISLQGGVACSFLEGYCFDSTVGEAVWNPNDGGQCEAELNMLYEGTASRIMEKATRKEYVVVENNDRTFALALYKQREVCYQIVWQTEHPRLVVQIGDDARSARIKTRKSAQNVDLTAYINSKFLYVEQSRKRENSYMYQDVLKRLCRLKREVLENRLMMAPFAPDAIAQLVEKEGRVGRVLGEVLYIIKCVPKAVVIRRTERCYKELPVTMNNESLFMAPVTRTLQTQAEEIDCSGIVPPLYLIDNRWVGVMPHPIYPPAPRVLEATGDPKMEFSPIQPLGEGGLYTREEVSQAQKVLTFGAERRAVENILTRKMSGRDTDAQGYSALKFFDPEEMRALAKSTIKQLYGWFSEVGTFVSGMIGFYAIFKLAKYVIGVTINGLQLYRAVGCGFTLIASVWNVLTFWVVQNQRAAQANRPPNEREPGMTDTRDATSAPTPGLYPCLNSSRSSIPAWSRDRPDATEPPQ